jgi:CRP-like cAMP-binding protein
MGTSQIGRVHDLELFADCRKAELRRIDRLTTLLRVPKDQVLMRQGDIAQQFIIVGDGTARLTQATDSGVAEVGDVGTGEFIGESELLSRGRLATTATATTDLTVFVSSAVEFRSILRLAPSVEHKVRRASLIRAGLSDAA